MRKWRHLVALVVLLLASGALLFVGDQRSPVPTPIPGPPRGAPRVVVALGDSTMSGEGGGDYEPGTNGENGDWCHRSSHASIHQIAYPGIAKTINLACSGANSAQIGLGDAIQYTERSQTQRLATIAATNRVMAVVVAVGANDDVAFANTLNGCVEAWFNSGGAPCNQVLNAAWDQRVDTTVPKIVRVLNDIKGVLADAGYRPGDYQLVLQSYASPIGPNVVAGLQDLSGCPFRSEDLAWVRNVALPVLTDGIRQAAAETGARYLDLSRAGDGHEACSSTDMRREWFQRLTVQWNDLRDERRATHALQESFHPNASGYAQLGRCLGEFLQTDDRAAACLAGADGNLHAAPTVDAR